MATRFALYGKNLKTRKRWKTASSRISTRRSSSFVEYEKCRNGDTYMTAKIQLPEIKVWADGILEERKRFWDGKKPVHVTMEDRERMREMQDEYYGNK
jgi:hypothetical protein